MIIFFFWKKRGRGRALSSCLIVHWLAAAELLNTVTHQFMSSDDMLFTETNFPPFQLFCRLNCFEVCFPGNNSLLGLGRVNFTVNLTLRGHWVLFSFVLRLHLEAFEKHVMLTITLHYPTLLGSWATRHIRNYYSCSPFRCQCGTFVLSWCLGFKCTEENIDDEHIHRCNHYCCVNRWDKLPPPANET